MINNINDYHAPEIPDKYKHDCLIIKDMHKNTRAVIYTNSSVWYQMLEKDRDGSRQVAIIYQSAPNSVAELRSYSHSTPDVFDEYSGYSGPRKSSMKTF